jgi:hypothetical protein
MMRIELSPEDINVVLAALGELPYKVAAGPVHRILQQLKGPPIPDSEEQETETTNKKPEINHASNV